MTDGEKLTIQSVRASRLQSAGDELHRIIDRWVKDCDWAAPGEPCEFCDEYSVALKAWQDAK